MGFPNSLSCGFALSCSEFCLGTISSQDERFCQEEHANVVGVVLCFRCHGLGRGEKRVPSWYMSPVRGEEIGKGEFKRTGEITEGSKGLVWGWGGGEN